ncbi:DNA polymerase III subunit epsilon [Vibrio sp. 947]|uniref:DNA polymerase III subunit epsilon n=1 Tax=unclassified Vibrio TaxID=2614977 RepID=UPI00296429F6|nr:MULTISPECIES: DNA polymerase III subunit epsilon [unclassified Vibrio]MDW1582349.1 DNA polymerase III subunit epsilon [Vibrio sp. Vb2897]MDW1640610.1 DNA polymerase III subunit epsilon [Vibrio sp. Vb2896]MDW1925993.1 DNA polymerase III subunit epsilon [Vibrio sp. 947]
MEELSNNRMIVLDTETTGFHPRDENDNIFNRIFEIGCVEIIDRKVTGVTFHEFMDPQREVEEDAKEVHGYSWEEIKAELKERGCPGQRFHDIAQKFINFVNGSPLVIHNAEFDTKFLDSELRNAGFPTLAELNIPVFCTYKFASNKYPGRRNNLDALCDRLGVDKSGRDLHGALIDADLTAQVYLMMTQYQGNILSNDKPKVKLASNLNIQRLDPSINEKLKVVNPNEAEVLEHNKLKERIDKSAGGSSFVLGL